MSDWASIPKTQTPGHRRGLPAFVKAGRISAGAVALTAVVAMTIVLWPLASGVGHSAGGPGVSESTSAQPGRGTAGPTDSSAATVSRLGSSYLFTVGRAARTNEEVGDVADAAPVVTPTEITRPKPARTEQGRDGVRVLRVESPEAVGGDVQKSFRELVLRAIHSDRSGEMVALIDFTGTPAGSASLRVGPGDAFTEPKHKDADWRVVAIDPDRNRVVLERENRRLALALFGTGPADLSPVVIAPEGERDAETPKVLVSEDGTVIVQQTADEAIAALRREVGPGSGDEKPITFEDLAELLRAFGDLERYGERARQEQLERERR